MGNVVKIDSDIIQTLEGLLDEAREGNLEAIAFATLESDGGASTGWSGVRDDVEVYGLINILRDRFFMQNIFPGSDADEDEDEEYEDE